MPSMNNPTPELQFKPYTFRDYMPAALRTAPLPMGPHDPADCQHAAYGLMTEIGEFVDIDKRRVFYHGGRAPTPDEITHMKEELGDALWYLAMACRYAGVTMEEVAMANIAKLQTRYPEKFESGRALNRNLAAELQTLERGAPFDEDLKK